MSKPRYLVAVQSNPHTHHWVAWISETLDVAGYEIAESAIIAATTSRESLQAATRLLSGQAAEGRDE